jgi:hypothetical protein
MFYVKKPFKYNGKLYKAKQQVDFKTVDKKLADYIKGRFLIPIKIVNKAMVELPAKQVEEIIENSEDKK